MDVSVVWMLSKFIERLVLLDGRVSPRERRDTLQLDYDRLEAVADYNLWIWHIAFEFAGLLSDINVWDRSPLFESMLDRSHGNIDFPLVINGEVYTQLFYLVDGIYLSMS